MNKPDNDVVFGVFVIRKPEIRKSEIRRSASSGNVEAMWNPPPRTAVRSATNDLRVRVRLGLIMLYLVRL